MNKGIELRYTKLALSQESGSTFTSKILGDKPIPSPLLNAINSRSSESSIALFIVHKNTTDIVQFLNSPYVTVKTMLRNVFDYPRDASFHLQAYKGVDGYEIFKR